MLYKEYSSMEMFMAGLASGITETHMKTYLMQVIGIYNDLRH